MMFRSALGAAAAAAVLSQVLPGPVTAAAARAAAPAFSRERTDPLAGLPPRPDWGWVKGRSGVLRQGCHSYRYRYHLTPPEGIWALEVHITAPGGKHVAAGAFLGGYDPEDGIGHYKVCKATARYGRFTIEGKVSVDDGAGHIQEGRLPADHYRLHRRR